MSSTNNAYDTLMVREVTHENKLSLFDINWSFGASESIGMGRLLLRWTINFIPSILEFQSQAIAV